METLHHINIFRFWNMKIELLHKCTYTPIYVWVYEGTVLKCSAEEEMILCENKDKKWHEPWQLELVGKHQIMSIGSKILPTLAFFIRFQSANEAVREQPSDS